MDATWVKPGQFFANESVRRIVRIETKPSAVWATSSLYHVNLETGASLLILAPNLTDRGDDECRESFTVTATMTGVDLREPRWCLVCEWTDRVVLRVTAKGEDELKRLAEHQAADEEASTKRNAR